MEHHSVENVVAMSYYSGTMPAVDGQAAHVLHVCLDTLADGRMVPTLRASSPMGGVIARSARCVDGLIQLCGESCTPEAYILQWRTVQAMGPLTLTAWLQSYEVTSSIHLPAIDTCQPQRVPAAYRPARARLFGSREGRCHVQLQSAEDIRDAALVMQALAAFDIPRKSLTETLTVSPKRSLALAA